MNRYDKEVHDFLEIESILREAQVIHIGLSMRGIPYVVPLCFGYSDRKLYIHGSPEGKKATFLEHNNQVSFNCLSNFHIVKGERPCEWSMSYHSVSGTGSVWKITEESEKLAALQCIMDHYGHSGKMEFSTIERTEVLCIQIEEITGKISST